MDGPRLEPEGDEGARDGEDGEEGGEVPQARHERLLPHNEHCTQAVRNQLLLELRTLHHARGEVPQARHERLLPPANHCCIYRLGCYPAPETEAGCATPRARHERHLNPRKKIRGEAGSYRLKRLTPRNTERDA